MSAPTKTLPARAPDGWWTGHPRYRNYVLFTMTGLALAGVNVILLLAVRALAGGSGAWAAFLGTMASPPVVMLSLVLLIATVFFAQRFARVGAKPLSVKIGPVPAIHTTAILIVQVGGLVTMFGVVMLLLSGVIGI